MEGSFSPTFSCKSHGFGIRWKEKAFWSFGQVLPKFICHFELWNSTFEPNTTSLMFAAFP